MTPAGLDLGPLWLSLRLAAWTTALLLLGGAPLAWWLARGRSRLRPAVEALVGLPLVLPPTVLGFYLLWLLSGSGPLGGFWAGAGGAPAFTFRGLVIGSLLYSLPFVVQPLQAAFRAVPREQLEAAATLGAGPLDRFLRVVAPQARHGVVAAAVLGFAHTVGEFGVVLMIGGSIPGRTHVLSIAIYDHVERLEYAAAHWLSGGLLLVSFLALWWVHGGGRGAVGVRT